MIDYIGVSEMRQIVQRIGVSTFIKRLAAKIEYDYRRWDEFDKSSRFACHSPAGSLELMPISDGTMFSFKYVNCHPHNTARGRLTVTAFGVLADVESGYPVLLSELTVATALRTAAMSVLAARHLARPNCSVMALIGNGAQSEFQAIGFHHVLGIRELRVFDIDYDATDKLERNLRAMPALNDLSFVRCASSAEACKGADIVTTVTADKGYAAILTPAMISPGVHINAVGGDCPGKTELRRDVLEMPNVRVIVEYEPQARKEGEVQAVPPDFPVVEFAKIAKGTSRGRLSSDDITIFDSVGFALQDHSALRFLQELLDEQRLEVRQIDLVPSIENPKDLLGGALMGQASRTTRQFATHLG